MSDSYRRPNPDALLAAIAEGERRRGRLKIFLGASAGVGKTYAMLEEGQRLKATGMDVVVGYVELHGRKETEALVVGLELVPRRVAAYQGAMLEEMDVAAVIRRQPALALVDELAHTVAPGTPHSKRYEEIEDLLASGIDVYSTVNVQHLESLNDQVAALTGVRVRETFPDRIISLADEVVLIDLPPEELRARIREGKVYAPGKVEQALGNFFRLSNLVALRELALREAADAIKSSSGLRGAMQETSYSRPRDESGIIPGAPRILVAVGPKPQDARLMRAGWRLAQRLNAYIEVIYVGPAAGEGGLSPQQEEVVAANRRLAKTLELPFREVGGKIVDALVAAIERGRFTNLVVGESTKTRWQEFWQGSVINKLVRQLEGVDVYIVADPDKRLKRRSAERQG